MNLPGYYSSGQFARLANVSVRTIRFYDKQNILKPSYTTPAGARFYTDSDLARLQQILLLKYLGFSLDDIRKITINDTDWHFMLNSLNLQKKLIQDRIEQMQLVENAITNTIHEMEQAHKVDWSQMLGLIHLTNTENRLKKQYQDASNISARIQLHRNFSRNTQGWFPWLFEQCGIKSGQKILEVGCGNGALWAENMDRVPQNVHIILSDISEGMLRDAKRNVGAAAYPAGQQPDALPGGDARFEFRQFDCVKIPYPDQSFDRVIANHLLFYCDDLAGVLREIRRVLAPGGLFLCSTYGSRHMKEISELVQEFDKHIVLSDEKLYAKFGLGNGSEILSEFFSSVESILYDDSIDIDCAQPIIEYILSCHGNQNQYILDRYNDFRAFVEKKTRRGLHITKEAGVFKCS